MTRGSEQLQRLLEKIYCVRGFDFRQYKETTLTRRLSRRLRARGVKTYDDYACILDQNPPEYDRLFNDLTINVTSFFRDEAAFKALEDSALPALINRNKKKRKRLNIWSAGCATGQEPYSIGMLLLEMLGPEISSWAVTILGTDIDAKVLNLAREGIFDSKEVEGIRQEWLDKYFVSEKKGLSVQPELRKIVTFAQHNLVSDQPYKDLDLVVCRNVLIYFTPGLQMQVLKNFHEGLKEGGFLLLGKAEVPTGKTRRLFQCVDKKPKLYLKAT